MCRPTVAHQHTHPPCRCLNPPRCTRPSLLLRIWEHAREQPSCPVPFFNFLTAFGGTLPDGSPISLTFSLFLSLSLSFSLFPLPLRRRTHAYSLSRCLLPRLGVRAPPRGYAGVPARRNLVPQDDDATATSLRRRDLPSCSSTFASPAAASRLRPRITLAGYAKPCHQSWCCAHSGSGILNFIFQ